MDNRMWFVGVVAKKEDSKRVIASCLLVGATNRFQAKVRAGESIRQSDEYKDRYGNTIPYTVTEITQLRIKDFEYHQQRFMDSFRSVFGEGEIIFRNTYLV